MTAVAAPAPPASAPRPIPWTRLAWVTWRQHRVALADVAVLLGGLGLYLLVMGLKIPQRLPGRGVLPPARVRSLLGGRQAVQQLPPDRG